LPTPPRSWTTSSVLRTSPRSPPPRGPARPCRPQRTG
jgi:hypothetical protein